MDFTLIFEAMIAQSPEAKLKLIANIEQMAQELLESEKPPSNTLDSYYLESSFQTQEIQHFFNDFHSPIRPLQSPSYQRFCTITHPTKIRRPKHIKSVQSLAKVLHSIVHIEYSAIDLALDAMYRFRHLPLQYYRDWLIVALQEANHFRLLADSLHSLGYEYGDFAVHSQLFDAQSATQDFRDRMALLHRGLEANGLDANPFVTAKIKAFEHDSTPQILQTLETILRDEIEHVRKGDFWWRYANTKTSPEDFLAILQNFKQFHSVPKILNHKARLQAGFSAEELKCLTHLYSTNS
ncbi:ferritin-like domain-containing protein [uncultured Helicobacter sp.]|uniref:ferritin-like domain-containing protein n=1 Tax=uncultured Helicobacter sp. TaxID=175537 RepID=UPI0025DC8E2D|nr:ferritin-like domain-containing protein [uncultured Helicobacter sp.]